MPRSGTGNYVYKVPEEDMRSGEKLKGLALGMKTDTFSSETGSEMRSFLSLRVGESIDRNKDKGK